MRDGRGDFQEGILGFTGAVAERGRVVGVDRDAELEEEDCLPRSGGGEKGIFFSVSRSFSLSLSLVNGEFVGQKEEDRRWGFGIFFCMGPGLMVG